jgi:prevent-host-death family protein
MTIGSYEAKTHLPSLLDRVAKGERITITKHGVPVAVLSPARGDTVDPSQAIEALRDFRKGRKLGRLSIRTLIEEGRR